MPNGDMIVASSYSTSNGDENTGLTYHNHKGELQWAKSIGVDNLSEYINGMEATPDSADLILLS